MSQRQPRRALEIYTVLQYAALLASPDRVAAFTNGVFILVQTAGGNFSRLVVKGENGIGPLAFQEILPPNPDLPSPPADVLLDPAAPSTLVGLGVGGVGESVAYSTALTNLEAVGALSTTAFQTAQHLAVVSGTVANINGGVAPFNAPGIGQMAFATDAAPGGTVPCWYNGAGWVTADGAALV